MCICICTNVYIYICTGICVYIHMYIHICLYVPVHVRPVGVGRVGGVAALARARAWAGPECWVAMSPYDRKVDVAPHGFTENDKLKTVFFQKIIFSKFQKMKNVNSTQFKMTKNCICKFSLSTENQPVCAHRRHARKNMNIGISAVNGDLKNLWVWAGPFVFPEIECGLPAITIQKSRLIFAAGFSRPD